MSISNRLAKLETEAGIDDDDDDGDRVEIPSDEVLAQMSADELFALHRATLRNPPRKPRPGDPPIPSDEELAKMPDAELFELHRRTLGLPEGWKL